jgi:hypothetical protein
VDALPAVCPPELRGHQLVAFLDLNVIQRASDSPEAKASDAWVQKAAQTIQTVLEWPIDSELQHRELRCVPATLVQGKLGDMAKLLAFLMQHKQFGRMRASSYKDQARLEDRARFITDPAQQQREPAPLADEYLMVAVMSPDTAANLAVVNGDD